MKGWKSKLFYTSETDVIYPETLDNISRLDSDVLCPETKWDHAYSRHSRFSIQIVHLSQSVLDIHLRTLRLIRT
jgi:hypothetical protein